MADGALFLVVLLFAVAAPLVLYALVRAEHDQRETMDRRDAERAARRDSEETTPREFGMAARKDLDDEGVDDDADGDADTRYR
ncbi:hypothetical protein [Halobellus captivus]|uniref:hypothetical protein n=1 Tax=Halobellus captivus TaxID=2592614 RepID=UPI0011A7CE51|nr:hypothetical protein [Halobellus captivus]